MQQAFSDGRSKADIAHTRLKDMIINGTLSAGEPLSVQHLSDSLQIGLTPVREALLRLQTEKIVAWSKKRGSLQVRLIGLKEATDLYDFALLILRHSVVGAVRPIVTPEIATIGAEPAVTTGADRWPTLTVARYVEQTFARIVAASANQEMAVHITSFNERTRLMRLIEIEGSQRHKIVAGVAKLTDAVRLGDQAASLAWLDSYFLHQRGRLPALVKEAIARNHALLDMADA